MRRTLLAFLVVFPLGLLAGCGGTEQARAKVSPGFFGISPQDAVSDADIARMGAGNVGSYHLLLSWARTETTEGVYDWRAYDDLIGKLAVQGIADSIRLARMRYVFRRFVDVNFGPEYAVPDLRVSKIQGKNLSVLARILADLSAAGLSFSDIRTQNDIRDLLEFEHMEELPAPARDAISSLPDDVGLDVAPRLPSPGGAPREGDSIAA